MHAACQEGWHHGLIVLFLHIFLLDCRRGMASMDVSDRGPESEPRARCPRCGVAFDCGRASRPFKCWCADMPALPAEAAQGGGRPTQCICPACYADALAAAGAAGAGTGDTPTL
ncbi:cysteine-rich CWC family protein [Trinickia soli]